MGFGTTGWSLAAKPCDSCKSAVAALFCRDDSAALCFSCDAKIHSKQTRPHERVWMCEVCEQAPAAVTCKADAAALCVSCDADIHSANPLARRHERVPVEPFFEAAESVVVRSSAFNFLVLPDDSSGGGAGACPHEEAEAEAEAWLLPNPNPNPKLISGATDVAKGGDMLGFFHEIDPFLDLDYGNSMDRFHGNTADGLVPVQTKVGRSPVVNGRFELDFCRPNNQKLSSFGYLGQSLSHSISSSSLDVGVVPDGNCNSMSDISYPAVQTSSSGADPCLSSSVASQSGAATQLCGMDREARVLRYREKRKNRKFEKTIRYASRKAYAETRPRIKGRFAKRNEVEAEDSIYSSVQYGVVPTF